MHLGSRLNRTDKLHKFVAGTDQDIRVTEGFTFSLHSKMTGLNSGDTFCLPFSSLSSSFGLFSKD